MKMNTVGPTKLLLFLGWTTNALLAIPSALQSRRHSKMIEPEKDRVRLWGERKKVANITARYLKDIILSLCRRSGRLGMVNGIGHLSKVIPNHGKVNTPLHAPVQKWRAWVSKGKMCTRS
jgi:hypothetical protein